MKTYDEYWHLIYRKHKTFKQFCKLTRHGSHSKLYSEVKKLGYLEQIEKEYKKIEDDNKNKILKELKQKIKNKYSTYHDFLNTNEYYTAKYNGFLKIIKSDIFNNERKQFKKSKWFSFETCFEESKKYLSRNDFRINSPTAYSYCKKNYIDKENGIRWLDVMLPLPSLKTKIGFVYCYFFKNINIDGYNNAVYVGITINPKRRNSSHKTTKNSSVYRFSKENGIEIPEMTILEENISLLEATRLEGFYIDNFSKENLIINKAKCGIGTSSVGGIKFVDEICSYNVNHLIEHVKSNFKNYESFKYDYKGNITKEYKRATNLCCIRQICNECGFKVGKKRYNGNFEKFLDDVKDLYVDYESFKHISKTNTRMTNMWVTAKRNGWLLKTVEKLFPDFINDVKKYI